MLENQPIEFNHAVQGGRVEVFGVRDDKYPGGWFYRFQYYHPEESEFLRDDNAHADDDLGWHHRHVRFARIPRSRFRTSCRTSPSSSKR